MRLRNSLMLLTAAATLPVVAFALAATVFVWDGEQENLRTAALNRNRAALAAADAQVLATMNTLRALSAVADSSKDQFETVRSQAVKVLATQPSWRNILIQLPDGRQLLNARMPPGEALPSSVADTKSFNEALTTKEPVVGHLSAALQLGGELGLAVRLPVLSDDRTVQYVLTAVLNPEAFQQQLERQKLPDDWVSGLVDGTGRLIARVPRVPVGTLASAAYRAQLDGANEGWYRGQTIEGKDTFTSFLQSELTGWSIGYAIPAEQVVGPVGRTSMLLGVGILVSLLSATAMGAWLTRRIAGSVEDLVAASAAMGSGTLKAREEKRFEELHRLQDAMYDADQKLWLRSQELRKADENKSMFLATLAHELRNPLAPLKNALTILERRDGQGDTKDLRAMMGRQVNQMARLIDDLLDVSRIDRGQLFLKQERLDLEEVLRNAVETALPGFTAKSQNLVIEPPAAPAVVEGDGLRLAQVIGNLLNNASKFSPAKATVVLSACIDGAECVVTVRDDGLGFEPAQAEAIFGMFVQLQPHTSGPGLGIGLSLARSLVEMHGGVLSASSKGPGRGAVFEMRLPLSSTASADSASTGTQCA